MPTTHPPGPGQRRAVAIALLATVCFTSSFAPGARAQIYVQALNENGNVSANSAGLGRLLSGFRKLEDDFTGETYFKHSDQRWWDLVVVGPDRYAIRLDGRVSKNGSKLFTLGFENLGEHRWIGLAVADGDVWALRTDGRVSRNGAKVVNLFEGDQSFRRIVSDGTHVYHLRTDGSVYIDDDKTPLYHLSGPGPEGDVDFRQWRDMALSGGRLIAMRLDGTVVSAATDGSDPLEGVPLANLPYGGSFTEAKAYIDISIRGNGDWVALRGSGEVYGAENGGKLLVDLPSGPSQNTRHRYMRIFAMADTFVVLRRDGRLFRETDPEPLVDLKNLRYRGLAVSTESPDLTEVKNQRPVVTRYKTVALEGEAITVPLPIVDRDLKPEDQVVTPDDETIPPGAVWDPVARTLTWDDPGPPGRYTFRVSVDDGVGKLVRVKLPIKVIARNTAPANKAPRPSSIKKARAQLQQPLVLPILAVDPDGDALAIRLVKAPDGAVFDDVTNTLTWKPAYDQLGRHRLRFEIDDGTVTRKLTVKVRVESSLLPW